MLAFCQTENFLCVYVRHFSITSPTGLKIKEGVGIFLWLKWPHTSLDLVKRASLDAVENHSRNSWHNSRLQNTLFLTALTWLLGLPSGWERRNSDLSSPWRVCFDGKDYRLCCIYSRAVPADRPELCATACLVGDIIHQTLDSLRLF